jgi:hypothetical protein
MRAVVPVLHAWGCGCVFQLLVCEVTLVHLVQYNSTARSDNTVGQPHQQRQEWSMQAADSFEVLVVL